MYATVKRVVSNGDELYNVQVLFTDNTPYESTYTYLVVADITTADFKKLIQTDALRFKRESDEVATPPPLPKELFELLNARFDVDTLEPAAVAVPPGG